MTPSVAPEAALEGFDGDVLVLNGDVPALRSETIRALVETHRAAGAAATVLSFEPADAGAYGRIVRDGDGRLARIVEAADASPEELALGEVNSGIYVFRAQRSSGRRSSGSTRTTRRASSTSPTRSACSSPTARPAPSSSPTIRSRPRA